MWSPDGKYIAFVSDRSKDFGIYIMPIDASGEPRSLLEPIDEDSPQWSKDGQHIFFVSTRTGNREIYKIDLVTLKITNLTMNQSEDFNPSVGHTLEK